MSFLKKIFLTQRFFYLWGGLIALWVLVFFFPWLIFVAYAASGVLVLALAADAYLIFHPKLKLKAERTLPRLFSLGDPNRVTYTILNSGFNELHIKLYDELPEQFQKRDFEIDLVAKPQRKEVQVEMLIPTQRGLYRFGNLILLAPSPLKFFRRRWVIPAQAEVKTYPSFLRLKSWSLAGMRNIDPLMGTKKIRRVGHAYEFEHIREYNSGDDYRAMNWKATGRTGRLMVNQFTDEKSQPVYCVINKGRTMHSPFSGLTLLDHSINTALAMLYVAQTKGDHIGLITYGKKVDTLLKASPRANQIQHVMEALYNEVETDREANLNVLVHHLKSQLQRRSLLLLFSNYDSHSALLRDLPLLRLLAKKHLPVVILFKNPVLEEFARTPAPDAQSAFERSAALHIIREKQLIVNTLTTNGIQCLHTEPEQTTLNTLNRYFELKARGWI